MKFLFFFIRYVPLFVQISILAIGSPELTPQFHFTPHDCFIWQVYQGVAAILLFSAVDYIIILRVHALYHNHPIVRKLVLVSYGLEITGMVVGLALSLPGIQFDEICVVTGVSDTLLIYGQVICTRQLVRVLQNGRGSTLLFQTFLFGLTVFKFVRALRDGWGDTPLVSLVIRDGTWAFILLFAAVAGDASLYGLKNHTFAGILFGWLLTVFSFSGYHVFLNLDRLSAGPSLPMSQTSTNASPIQFTTRIMTDGERADAIESYELSTLNPTTSGTSR
ncbi:hypothetical protein DFH07DRAFT_994922 [Mycena maculata]|uniref:Uncharacterized protein n=1 Tax=Mycena maculata TaxID=230809 RepID=A0AAD7HXT6_9AGAR|nr:hypothetical protein DFH07DRAFT_994922 [Mycena maculata]